MVFVYVESRFELAHVKRVEVVVFIGHRKVERFHRVPAKSVGSHSHHQLADRCGRPCVVQRNIAVIGSCCKHVDFHWIELSRRRSASAFNASNE